MRPANGFLLRDILVIPLHIALKTNSISINLMHARLRPLKGVIADVYPALIWPIDMAMHNITSDTSNVIENTCMVWILGLADPNMQTETIVSTPPTNSVHQKMPGIRCVLCSSRARRCNVRVLSSDRAGFS